MRRMIGAACLLLAAALPGYAESTAQKLFELEQRALARADGTHLEALVTPAAAGATGMYSRAWLSSQPKAKGNAEWRCLAEALSFEARGDPVQGPFAVAEVLVNRVNSTRFPNSICGVVNQGTGRKFACQFTYTCDGHKETILEPKAWDRVGKVATLMLNGAPRILTHGATHYHTKNVNPRWARVFPLTATIGMHRFYRQPTRTASAS